MNPSLKGTNKTAMALVSLLVHIIFSTKNRADLIKPEIETGLFAYIGGIANNNKSKLIAAGGTMNHVHLLVSLGEFRGFLRKYNIEYDERYVWD